MSITVKLMGEADVRALIAQIVPTTSRSMANAIGMSTFYIENDAKEFAPKDTVNLASRIGHELITTEKSIVMRIGVDSAVKYAFYVERGTRPHIAPVGDWGIRHGFDTEVMWVSGRAQPFLSPALEKNRRKTANLIKLACTAGWDSVLRKS